MPTSSTPLAPDLSNSTKVAGRSAPQRGAAKFSKSPKKMLFTATFCAFSIFIALNAVLWKVAGEEKVKGSATDSVADLWSGAGSIDLTVNGFKALKERPTVVLLGSSLVMHPFWSMDAQLDKKIDDIFHHHSSITFGRELEANGCSKQNVYSFAVFGEMASDGYIYANDFLKGDKKPDVVVLGMAPRDFSDAYLTAPTATFTFKKVVGLSNFGRYADAYLPGWQDKADFIATHACYFYGKRWRLQHELEKGLTKAYHFFHLDIAAKSAATAATAASQAGYMSASMIDDRWKNSAKEYRARYRDIENKDLTVQMGFLQKTLAVCKERGIKVVLVNMPLSDTNRELLPSSFYADFRQRLGNLAEQSGNVQYVDLGDASEFNHSDFWDTAHLNFNGGHKLLAHITPVVKKLELETPLKPL
ncbi:MAG: hypothetical protein P4L53_13810 [Candidatus Obscuribacterales bacterium]|nr:hypothetical protein [Candidatus Obscuribacterales bacterium]